MSSKKKSVEMNTHPEKKPPLFHRKRFNLIYTIVLSVLFVVGFSLILVFTIIIPNDYGFWAGLGVGGLAIILFTSRTTYKHSVPCSEKNRNS